MVRNGNAKVAAFPIENIQVCLTQCGVRGCNDDEIVKVMAKVRNASLVQVPV